ncbi:MAG: methyltransferase domain-containing protein [Bacteroidetes bacterium]|nr:methyltransferase domain-containing protein [Bacteroidota bacterium]
MQKRAKWKLAQKLELWWWKQYLAKKETNQYSNWKSDYWNKFLITCHFNPNKKLNILDAGCGPAGIFTVLQNHTVTAIDPLLDKYHSQLKHFDKSHYPWVDFQSVPLEEFRTNQKFDTIFCINAINHVNHLEEAIGRLTGLLNENGTLYLTTDCHKRNFLKWLFRAIPGDALHPHQHTVVDYENLLVSQGFKIELVETLKPGNIFDYTLFTLKHA